MNATARLVALYFSGTVLARWLTSIGVALVVLALASLGWTALLAQRLSGANMRGSALTTLSAHGALAILVVAGGVCALFLASTLMPTMLARQSTARQISVLPYGEPKLLASAVVTVLLVALPPALALPLLLSVVKPQVAFAELFVRTYVLACLNLTLLYFAYWIASTRRTAGGRLAGSMILVAIILGPTGGKFLADPSASIAVPAVAMIVVWLAFACLHLRSNDVRAVFARVLPRLRWRESRLGDLHDTTARIDLLLGTSRPWRLALIQIVPVIVATRLVRSPQAWLFYLTIFSGVSGAVASTAASNARSLWLRAEWSRPELFSHVERAFLRHNSYALGLLLMLLVVAGTHLDLPIRLLAHGLLLVTLGSAVSTYLGLMMTRSLGWREIVLSVFTMGLLMTVALLASLERTSMTSLALAECALAALACAFRRAAMQRWLNLDWMECRRRRRATIEG